MPPGRIDSFKKLDPTSWEITQGGTRLVLGFSEIDQSFRDMTLATGYVVAGGG